MADDVVIRPEALGKKYSSTKWTTAGDISR
jgi:hypothetical protein